MAKTGAAAKLTYFLFEIASPFPAYALPYGISRKGLNPCNCKRNPPLPLPLPSLLSTLP